MVVEILVNLLLVDIGQQARDRLEHEDQHQQDSVLEHHMVDTGVYTYFGPKTIFIPLPLRKL